MLDQFHRLLWRVLKQAAIEWYQDKVPRLGAALAYYTIFSIVPMLMIIIMVLGVAFGTEVAHRYVIEQLSELLGQQSAEAIKEMIQHASQPRNGLWATVIATFTLLVGASGFFGQLQEALNDIWGVESKPGAALWAYVQARFISLVTVLGTGFLLMASLMVSAGVAAFGRWYAGWLPAPEIVLRMLDLAVSLVVITVLFAMIFKFLPDVKIAWKDVWIGSILTAVLFVIGKFAIGVYIGNSDFGTMYGAAGSLVIVLVWIYYSTQILLFGAEFTQVSANMSGAAVLPSQHAVVTNLTKTISASGWQTTSQTVRTRMSTSSRHDETAGLSVLGVGIIQAVCAPILTRQSSRLRKFLFLIATLLALRWVGRHPTVDSSVPPRKS